MVAVIATGRGGHGQDVADARVVLHQLPLSVHRERRAEEHEHLSHLVQHPSLFIVTADYNSIAKTRHHVTVRPAKQFLYLVMRGNICNREFY